MLSKKTFVAVFTLLLTTIPNLGSAATNSRFDFEAQVRDLIPNISNVAIHVSSYGYEAIPARLNLFLKLLQSVDDNHLEDAIVLLHEHERYLRSGWFRRLNSKNLFWLAARRFNREAELLKIEDDQELYSDENYKSLFKEIKTSNLVAQFERRKFIQVLEVLKNLAETVQEKQDERVETREHYSISFSKFIKLLKKRVPENLHPVFIKMYEKHENQEELLHLVDIVRHSGT